MDNLRAVIKNLFSRISPCDILKEDTFYDNLKEDKFLQLGNGYIMNYSNDELKNMYYFLENEFLWHKRKMELSEKHHAESSFNVFDALLLFDDAVLIEENGEPKCQYIQLLRWRDVVTELEEDLFITSFFAYHDQLHSRERYNFFWKPVIGHNNYELNRLLEQGVAENHFHLKSSAPTFHLAWLSLMNQVDSTEYQEVLKKWDTETLRRKREYNVNYKGESLCHMWRQASLIRLFLFCVLSDNYLVESGCYKGSEKGVDDICGQAEINEAKIMYEAVKDLLANEKKLSDKAGVLQENILRFRKEIGKGKRNLDYMICQPCLHAENNYQTNEILSGERWFMYKMFLKIYQKEKPKHMVPYFNLFYLYLVLKANIRNELLQANENVGFDNFSAFENRKDAFLKNTTYKKYWLRMAVRDTIDSQHIVSLEARIGSKDSEGELFEEIKQCDKWITDGLEEKDAENLKKKYFYVLHFSKKSERYKSKLCKESEPDVKKDDSDTEKSVTEVEKCRHSQLRETVKRQALALVNFRENRRRIAYRIRGIDAASAELWCRPEVFAQAFRYLKNHTVDKTDGKENAKKIPQLLATYHVGEDFLDITDGLRAIDEAIHFFDLKCGERIGHALALGVDVEEWYEQKSNSIIINKIRYLDDLVWLYSKIKQYNIRDANTTILYIENRFDEYFQEIFLNNMKQKKIDDVRKKAEGYYYNMGVQYGDNYGNLSFTIGAYYDAWKLRGDDPALYQEGYFKLIETDKRDEWDRWAVNKTFPDDYRSRFNLETAYLVYMYYYNDDVKVTGDQMVEIKVSASMRDVIKQIQIKYQQEIAARGISIETNPSSNCRIGTFRRYEKHPIVRWYNLGLTSDPEELRKCFQLKVSINTDDQGVFATSIENEYGCMALALEKSIDEFGNRRYNRAMIMQWLDNIRKMGISHTF